MLGAYAGRKVCTPRSPPKRGIRMMTEAPPVGSLVQVQWRDAYFDFDIAMGENESTRFRDDYLVVTVGFIIRQTDIWLSVAQEVLPDGDGWRAVTHIPLGQIEGEIVVLTEWVA